MQLNNFPSFLVSQEKSEFAHSYHWYISKQWPLNNPNGHSFPLLLDSLTESPVVPGNSSWPLAGTGSLGQAARALAGLCRALTAEVMSEDQRETVIPSLPLPLTLTVIKGSLSIFEEQIWRTNYFCFFYFFSTHMRVRNLLTRAQKSKEHNHFNLNSDAI